MDYDDNDLNSQNFHLAGESSTKFPPGLQPYALPKFDFDDSHLRFDSLVETEVFLGIESNQDNHWIEDFSRGGSGIEFNSSAAEPCSISRRNNNVWSEATSSESVEMLLKSVGQEEIIVTPTVFEELISCNERVLLTKQMDPSLKHDENIPSQMEDVKTSEETLPPNEASGEAGEDSSCVEDASKTQGGLVLNSIDQSTDSVKVVLPLDEEGVFADIGCDDVNQKEVSDNQPQANDANFEKPEDIKEDVLNDQHADASVAVLTENPDEKTIHSVSEVGVTSVDASGSNVEEPSIGSLEGHSVIHTVGGSSNAESFVATDVSECEPLVICEDKLDQSKDNVLDAPLETLTSDAPMESSKSNALENRQQLDSDIVVRNPDSLSAKIHVPATIVAELTLTHEKDDAFVETNVYVCSEDVCVSGKANVKLSNDCSEMNVDSPGKEDGSSSSCQDVDLTNSNLVGGGVPLPCEDSATIASSQTSLPVVESNQLEVEKETVTETLAEPSLPSSVSEAEGGVTACDTGGPLLGNATEQSLPLGNNNETETPYEAPDPTIDGVGEDAAKALDPTTDITKMIIQSESIPLVQTLHTSQKDHEDNGGSSTVQNVTVLDPPVPSHAMHVEGIKDLVKQDVSVSKADGKAKKNASNSRAPKIIDISMDRKAGSSAKPASKIAEGSPSFSLPFQVDPKTVQDVPQTSAQVSDKEIAHGRQKSTSERKPRRSSVKGSAKKGTQSKERLSEKPGNVLISPAPAIFHVMQSNELQPYGHIDVNNNKPYFVLAASSSSLPDLNSSVTSSNVFQQPFTDFQQVQLRAQIFVYGALIQGTAPEEAYMMSAFGGLDGGKSMWGNAWQAIIERLQNQKSTLINPETPLYSRQGTPSVSNTVDQVSKQATAQTKGTSTPVGRSTAKSSPTVSPLIPLSSPLWSMPTPGPDTMQSNVMPRGSVMDYQQVLTPFQTPSHRNILGNSPSWMPQPSYRGPWVPSPQPSLPESSARFSSFPSTETVQLTPAVKEASVSQSSTKLVSPSPTVQTGAPTTVFAGASPLVDLKKVTPSKGQQSSEPKTRKRKKNSAPAPTPTPTPTPTPMAETSQIMISQPEVVQQVLPPVLPIDLSTTSATIQTPTLLFPQARAEKLFFPLAQPPLLDPLIQPNHDVVVPRAIITEESLGDIKEARKHAEDATAMAAAAIVHSQDIWSQLEKQKNSGLVSDPDAKLASATVAVTAATAVAKAAAAAANVALNAALQAKLMAEEAFVLNKSGSFSQGSIISSPGSSSSSILTAAREAARRRVEAASAAAKRAENMDAIVKAAELASEAVSHAGKIVAMGDPLSLSELIEAGPEGYWRAPQKSPEQVSKSADLGRDPYESGRGLTNSIKPSKGGRSGKKGSRMTADEQLSISRDVTTELIDGTSGSVAGQNGNQFSDVTKNIVVVLESDPIPVSSTFNVENDVQNAVQDPKGNIMREGSKVEVFKVGNGLKAAWYIADVLSLNDGKACVSYTEIEENEDSMPSEEWVALTGEGDNPPKIRITRPVTTLEYEGTRKKRKAAMVDYNWNVGDRVDAWMNSSWWEGVVTEKNKKDETSVTVHFPAHNETSPVKVWHLRSSLHWKDGQWVEWPNLQPDSSFPEGDTRPEKQRKLGSPAVEVKGKDKTLKASNVSDSGKLELSGTERAFNIGKSSKAGTKPDPTRMARSGLQKEGSRVVFGIPKPGKKRKFMEVSKHYDADPNNRNDEPSDSIKHLKYSAPQGTRSLRNDPKEKRVAESKLKGLKPGKQQTAFGRTIPQNFSAVAVSNSGDGSADTGKVKDSSSHSDVTSRAEGTFVFSAVATSESSKKFSSSSGKHDRGNKGKLGPVGRKLGKIEEEKVGQNLVKSTSEAAEPRRSNRRIQPTSRLLEGLQSSLIMPKFPTLSHDKGQRSQSKNNPRGNNRG